MTGDAGTSDGSAAVPAGPGPVGAGSALGRLFTYSKDAAFSAHENFTTEALAWCVRRDPRPMLNALSGLPTPLWEPVQRATHIWPTTQVYVERAGFVDLVLALLDGNAFLAELWLEVKIDAPEGDQQLRKYAAAARAQSAEDGVLREVVALAKAPLQPDVAWLDWRRVYAAASRSDEPLWCELRLFLEETGVTDMSMVPISDREAGSIADAARLIRKVSEVIRAVHRKACALWAASPARSKVCWSSDGALLNHVGAVFRQSGRMIAEGSTLRYGAVDVDGTAFWYLAVCASGQREARLEQLVARAKERGLGPDWQPRLASAEFLVRTIRVAERDRHEHAVAWFADGLGGLQASGLIEELVAGRAQETSPTTPQ